MKWKHYNTFVLEIIRLKYLNKFLLNQCTEKGKIYDYCTVKYLRLNKNT